MSASLIPSAPRKAVLVEGMEEQLRKLGLLDRIDAVLESAAPVTHAKGNRRYHQFILDVQGDVLLSITDTKRQPVKLPSKANPGTFVAWDPCDCPDGKCGKCVDGYVKVERKL